MPSDVNDVSVALGGDHTRDAAVLLQNGVGGGRGSVQNSRDLALLDAIPTVTVISYHAVSSRLFQTERGRERERMMIVTPSESVKNKKRKFSIHKGVLLFLLTFRIAQSHRSALLWKGCLAWSGPCA